MGIQRIHAMHTAMHAHIKALNALTTTARLMRWPFCSCSHSAIEVLAPKNTAQVNSECWSAWPLAWMASSVGR